MELERKRKQSLGATIYSAYAVGFLGLMYLATKDQLPVFEWELMDEEQALWINYFMKDTFGYMFVVCAAYLVTIFGIQAFMRDRKPFDLRLPLAIWSFSLAAFSLWGALRVVPTLLELLAEQGFATTCCLDARSRWWGNKHPTGIWVALFVVSKVPELVDTLFIVLRKKSLITLHWYHHVTVLLFSWNCGATYAFSGIFFSSMNLTVHAFMYVFYGLTALGYRPTVFAQTITLMQISQMIVGTAVTAYIMYDSTILNPTDFWSKVFTLDVVFDRSVPHDSSPECKINPGNAFFGFLMYLSYLILFLRFFYSTYIAKKPKVKSN